MNVHNLYVTQLVESAGVWRKGHFVLTSGLHSDQYFNKDDIYPHVRLTTTLGAIIAKRFDGLGVETVVGPALGGITLAQRVASALCHDHWVPEVLAIYAEKIPGGGFTLGRDYAKHVTGKVVLCVEDVLTTGNSASQVIELVRAVGGQVAGLGAICNRGQVRARDFGLELSQFKCLLELDLPTWPEADCPLCKAGAPINTEVGKGREYLLAKSD